VGTDTIAYDVTTQATKRFFATVQNELHGAIRGQTAAEVVYQRADADKDNMRFTSSKDAALGKIQIYDIASCRTDYSRAILTGCSSQSSPANQISTRNRSNGHEEELP
jgi:hypothetical protein